MIEHRKLFLTFSKVPYTTGCFTEKRTIDLFLLRLLNLVCTQILLYEQFSSGIPIDSPILIKNSLTGNH